MAPPSGTALERDRLTPRHTYSGMQIQAGGPDDGITHAPLSDAESKTTVGNAGPDGFALSPIEAPSDHPDLDHPIPKIGEELDGDKSAPDDLTDGDQSTHSDESASCEKVARNAKVLWTSV